MNWRSATVSAALRNRLLTAPAGGHKVGGQVRQSAGLQFAERRLKGCLVKLRPAGAGCPVSSDVARRLLAGDLHTVTVPRSRFHRSGRRDSDHLRATRDFALSVRRAVRQAAAKPLDGARANEEISRARSSRLLQKLNRNMKTRFIENKHLPRFVWIGALVVMAAAAQAASPSTAATGKRPNMSSSSPMTWAFPTWDRSAARSGRRTWIPSPRPACASPSSTRARVVRPPAPCC